MHHAFRKLPLLLALLLPALARGAPPETVEGLEWRWPGEETRRWYVEAEVQLPSFLWFVAARNKEVRVAAFQVRMLVDCPPDGVEEKGRKAWRIECTIGDVGLKAAALAGDEGRLQPILEELDENLTGAVLQMTMRHDGRITAFDLEEVEETDRRSRAMQQTLRLALARAMAGLDLELPRDGIARGAWAQNQSMIMMAPSSVGSQGASEIAHQVVERRGTKLVIATSGRGMIVPGDGTESYATRLEGAAVFDLEEGVLSERVWTALGEPTASSGLAEGYAGIPYGQRGRLGFVDPGEESPDVGETLEVAAPGVQPSALQQWSPLGLGAREAERSSPGEALGKPPEVP